MNLNDFCKKNWYTLRDTLDWINLNRYEDWYSVTTVLQLLYDPTFNYIYKTYKAAVDKACKEWTEEHLKVEKFFDAKSGVKAMNANFMKFLSLYNAEPLQREITEYREYNWIMFRWTIDSICMIDYPTIWNSIYNVDWKNSKTHSEKYLLQLAWYKWLNRYDWILVYWKDKLVLKEYTWEYDEVWQELIYYFLKLHNEKVKEILTDKAYN